MLALLLSLAAPGMGQGMEDAIARAVDPCRDARRQSGITVCGRNHDREQRRFRLPGEDRGFDPTGSVDSVSRSRHRLIDGDGASQDLTRGSCSAVGASGATGCMVKGWREKDQQKGW